MRTPRKLRRGDVANFTTLKRAMANDDLALVSAVRKADGADVALLCAMDRGEDGSYIAVPLAVMVEGNPYDLFHDPTED